MRDAGAIRIARRPAGLYVHLPCCASRCSYCDFVSTTDRELWPALLGEIVREVASLGRREPRPLATLYLGGGTPSLVPAEQLAALFESVWSRFSPVPGAEITLEANPEDVSEESLGVWRRLGVTRLSLGIQSFDDGVLTAVGRRHTAERGRLACRAALDAGFHVSADLILGLPGLDEGAVARGVDELIRLRPHHVSVYLLELDKVTEMSALAARRPERFPRPLVTVRQYLKACGSLVAAGYRHYEISNLALPGFASRHNRRYWTGRTVLAAGPGAHGQAGRRRWANQADLGAYVAAVRATRRARVWSRCLDVDELTRESIMLGLRLARGVEQTTLVKVRSSAFHARLADFLELGLARRTGARVRLTPRGWLVSNELLAEL